MVRRVSAEHAAWWGEGVTAPVRLLRTWRSFLLHTAALQCDFPARGAWVSGAVLAHALASPARTWRRSVRKRSRCSCHSMLLPPPASAARVSASRLSRAQSSAGCTSCARSAATIACISANGACTGKRAQRAVYGGDAARRPRAFSSSGTTAPVSEQYSSATSKRPSRYRCRAMTWRAQPGGRVGEPAPRRRGRARHAPAAACFRRRAAPTRRVRRRTKSACQPSGAATHSQRRQRRAKRNSARDVAARNLARASRASHASAPCRACQPRR